MKKRDREREEATLRGHCMLLAIIDRCPLMGSDIIEKSAQP